MPALDKSVATSATLIGAGLSLNLFWILNVLKEAFPPVKEWLTFYAPVGPLLGLFTLSIVGLVTFMVLMYILLKNAPDKEALEKDSFWVFVVSTIIFFFLVFPPVFEPLVHLLAGK